MDGPNPLRALLSVLGSRRLRKPAPRGCETVDHSPLDPVLAAVAAGGVPALEDRTADLSAYISGLAEVDPDTLSPGEAKAFWLNLYNAGALDLARRTWTAEAGSVLRVPGGFTEPFVAVAGETLSLDGIEHGKVRRLGDPRIHAALVCGSASCPTLRSEAYQGHRVDVQLDAQMTDFLTSGAAQPDRAAGRIRLSRVFLWYGADFVRPGRMPTLLPARKRSIRDAVAGWMAPEDRQWIAEADPAVEFQAYDWSLACSVR